MDTRASGFADRSGLLESLSRHRALRLVDRPELEKLVAYAQMRALPARSRLFAAGDVGSALYVVVSGWLKLSREGPNGRDVVLEVAGAGSLFGELAVICGLPRAADAIALTPCNLLCIDGRALVSALRRSPDATLEIVRMLGERLARTTAQMEETLMPAEPRLARALTRLAALDPRPSKAGLDVDIGLSQRELGEMTGLARESINKQLSLWRDAGIVALNGRVVTLLDAQALRDVAEG